MQWWEILVGIILFIVALGVLIGIHELGHLGAAKLFHVYCFNYSIGFGPKIFSTKRTEKHETTWSLRAVPLGGFVSMYGEGMETEDGEFIPPSRSLEGVARYKRAVIISAGVFLNFILGFVLILLHNGCFDHIYFTFNSKHIDNNVYQTAMVCSVNNELISGVNDEDELKLHMDPFAGVFLIEEGITLNDNNYILCMDNIVTTTKTDPLLSNSLVLYQQKEISTVADEAVQAGYSDARLISFICANDIKKTEETAKQEIQRLSKEAKDARYKEEINLHYTNHGFNHAVDLSKKYTVNKDSPDLVVTLPFYEKGTDEIKPITTTLKPSEKGGFNDCGVYMKRFFERYDAGKTFAVSWEEWCGANTAVFRGLGMLFTGRGEVSGPIGIAQMSTNILANFGFERYLYLWGMISCNLAILNLLPFPGLDGWSLVVIGYEAITKKQIKTKVKGIISVIGLGLLFLLMIFIIIKDIIGLF